MRPKHSIIVITYNQEHLIGRAIDSLLCQKDHVYEIIISDDCSTDNTWKVIQKYYEAHPRIIKPYRNDINLGIFGNIESTWSKAEGDIIWYLSGDDIYCDGLFKKADEALKNSKIDIRNDFYSLYFDFKREFPNGKSNIHSNSKVLRHNPLSLKLRNLIYNRTIGVSKKVYDSYVPVKKNIGIMADGLIDIQAQLFSKINLYIPFVGSVYFAEIGIGSKTKRQKAIQSYIKCIPEYFKLLDNINNKDVKWLYYLKYRYEFELNPNFKRFRKYTKSLFSIFSLVYGFKFIIKQFLYYAYLIFKAILSVDLFNKEGVNR
jgi:glycosyltransferase involved in cell wall biosynthesis